MNPDTKPFVDRCVRELDRLRLQLKEFETGLLRIQKVNEDGSTREDLTPHYIEKIKADIAEIEALLAHETGDDNA